MPKTILITGASSGIGKATAQLFLQKGWNVVATMRSPDMATELARQPNCLCRRLDVTDHSTIAPVIEQAIAQFGTIDGLVNNAGYALIGAFEACSEAEIRRQFDTNVLGLMAVTQAILPHFRERRAGTIVNVASIGGQMAFPLYSLYHASKWAVEGFSDSLQYELKQFNIKVKLIEPGPIKTDFYKRSMTVAQRPELTVYDTYTAKILPALNQAGEQGSPPEVTAGVIYRSMTDGSNKLRYPAGGNADALLTLRKLLPDEWMQAFVRLAMER
jgi:NADP-dependent 3-hydroxy acid dehydrogenase YdfG